MYTLMIGIEYISIALLIFEIIYVMNQKGSYMQNLMLLLLISVLVNLVGYLVELKSDSLETALIGVKIAYLGKPYITLCIFFFVVEFCKVNLSDLLKGALVAFHLLITTLVFTCDLHSLFYTSIRYIYSDSYCHLVLGHGLFYYMFIGMTFLYFIAITVIGIRKIRSTKDWLIKRQMFLCLAMITICLIGFLLFLSGCTNGYDTTVLSYFVCVQMLIILMVHFQLFNTLSFAKDESMDGMEEALFVFDNDDGVIYQNKNARLMQHYIEKHYTEPFVQVLKKLIQKNEHLIVKNGYVFRGEGHDHEDVPQSANSVYHITGREITRQGRTYGYAVLVSDETESYYYTSHLEAKISAKTHEIIKIQRSVIGSFAAMIEARDGITGLHIKNTSNFVKILTHAMQNSPKYADRITDDYAQMVSAAAKLHDIGKIAVPDYVLQKPGKLTDEEYEIMKKHPAEGARIIKETLGKLENDEYVHIAYNMAYYHHEKFAGGGYPCNLKGTEIPLSARIMAICDVYDALRSNRHYKEGFSVEKSVSIIRESRGSHFDPDITDIFLQHIDEMEAVFIQNNSSPSL